MKRVRLTIEPVEADLPPIADVYHRSPFVEEALGLQWNVARTPTSLVSLVDGDREAVEAALDEHPHVLEFETADAGDEFLCYGRTERTEAADRLFEPYRESEMIVVPPVRYDDVGMHAEVVGDAATVQAVVDGAEEGVRVRVESIHQFATARETILGRLTDRQREALETARRVGYYDVPRDETHEAVAEAMGVSPSTASEHLRKAEAKLIDGILEGR